MLNLQPYEIPQYFLYLIIAFPPVISGIFHGFRMHWSDCIFSLVFLVLIFDAYKCPQGKALLGCVVFHLLLVYASFQCRVR
ncbi:D-alanyl-lipoteichoic acid biosynthesis protein DltB, partial [Lacticaseibacillus casei]|nr:D-alanyl-lipoteichoic acid biosynthesis protein DltB [Lacticaseibacillus casei]